MRFHSKVMAVAVAGIWVALGCGCAVPQLAAGWLGLRPPLEPVSGRESQVRRGPLLLALRVDPFPLKLSETRRMELSIQLKNVSKRYVQLEFPTTQRFDATIHDDQGKLLAQWSEDEAFEARAGAVGINPGEQVEYKAQLATRDLQPGRRYTMTVVFPTRKELKTELRLAPEP